MVADFDPLGETLGVETPRILDHQAAFFGECRGLFFPTRAVLTYQRIHHGLEPS